MLFTCLYYFLIVTDMYWLLPISFAPLLSPPLHIGSLSNLFHWDIMYIQHRAKLGSREVSGFWQIYTPMFPSITLNRNIGYSNHPRNFLVPLSTHPPPPSLHEGDLYADFCHHGFVSLFENSGMKFCFSTSGFFHSVLCSWHLSR